MRQRWVNLNDQDRDVFRAVLIFLSGRLKERATIDWALRLKPNDTVKRLALLDAIDSQDSQKVGKLWRIAWRLIEESWSSPPSGNNNSIDVFKIQQRLRAGDRSGALISAIVELVAPRLTVKAFSNLDIHYRELPKRPKKVEDLFSVGITSGKTIDPGELGLGDISDQPFLMSLVIALDATVANGLDIARRIGWDGEFQSRRINRVYYVPVAERAERDHEPDEFDQQIAPSVKLLHAVVAQLVDIDISSAGGFVRLWKQIGSPVYLRLWAALSRDPRIMHADEVGTFLLSLDDQQFWKLNTYPEISELRAKRFSELDTEVQAELMARIRKRPPRKQWRGEVDTDEVDKARTYCAIQELRRIEFAGVSLLERDQAWLDARINEFPDLVQMERFDEGFMGTMKAYAIPANPDSRYDLLAGEDRLNALEDALSSARNGWGDNPADRARDWIGQSGNPLQILGDFETTTDGGNAFARVWEGFGWAHSPATGENTAERELQAECARVLLLLSRLSEATVSHAIAGISNWLSAWQKQVVILPEGLGVWFKLWPIAVETTNSQQSVEEEAGLNMVAPPDDQEPMPLDTLNPPVGKLIGVFFEVWRSFQGDERSFETDTNLRNMREMAINTTGRSRLISLHRMIEQLPYFLNADPDWTNEYLITPLKAGNAEALAFWHAIARQTLFQKVIKIIGNQMAEHAADPRFDRNTRNSLVFSLVIEALHALREGRDPEVLPARMVQMIRSVDDEVRAHGAEAIQRFVHDMSVTTKNVPNPPSPEVLFRSAAAPFLLQFWPQERSLSTQGVSRALADLPATARGAFAEVVDVIERFLVPFECWSMIDYGLYGEENGESKLLIIDDHVKAKAFLRLLNLTIGVAEGAVIPNDLADALDQIRRVAPNLAGRREFRRLATAARRG